MFRSAFFKKTMSKPDLNQMLEVLFVGVVIYPFLILLLRFAGKRSLSKMNAFDFVVTIALGSTLSSALLSPSVTLWQALTAFVFLLGAQYLVSRGSVQSESFQRLIKAEPKLLFHNGQFLEKEMKVERVSRDEILAAIRETGTADLSQVAAVVLETQGEFSVLKQIGTSLKNVTGSERLKM
jgi:uncharacterized membrane protein YcaP (DUF421 family)